MLVKNIFYLTDTAKLNLGINKTQETILMAIKDYQNKSMCEISQFIGLEKSSYTRSIEILVEKGFVEKIPMENDRRKINLKLTKKGIDSAKLVDDIMDSHLDNISSLFDSKEKETIINALKIVTDFSHKIVENKNGGFKNGTKF